MGCVGVKRPGHGSRLPGLLCAGALLGPELTSCLLIDNTLFGINTCSALSIPKPWSLLQEAVSYNLSPSNVFGDTQGTHCDSVTGKQIK